MMVLVIISVVVVTVRLGDFDMNDHVKYNPCLEFNDFLIGYKNRRIGGDMFVVEEKHTEMSARDRARELAEQYVENEYYVFQVKAGYRATGIDRFI